MFTEWPPDRVDKLLELVLPCETEQDYWRTLAANATEFGWTRQTAHKEGNQIIFRRAVKRTAYYGPAAEGSRTNRGDRPWTWIESRILVWASRKENSIGTFSAVVEYVAILLQRPVADILANVPKPSAEKLGIKGFFL